jgi:phospho-N-acetylmuramoyl-pentapeptide-transferase
LCILVKKELLLPLLGGVFFAETISVLIQRYYFKYTKKKYGEGRRIFKMAPLHHHFEMMGIAEPKIVMRFYIIAIILAIMTLATFKVR